eukprot:4674091-Alexandrium_andersonii.AAC.1
MSASLVGSEMCIRDRSRKAAEKRRTLHTALLSECCCPCGRARDSPVSYTHLTLPTICSV